MTTVIARDLAGRADGQHEVVYYSPVQRRFGGVSAQVQREGGFLDPIGYIARKAAAHIPGFYLFTVVIGYNPITRESVDRSVPDASGR